MIKKTLVIIVIILSFSIHGFSQNWQMVGGGMNWETKCFYTDTLTNTLFVGGSFSTSGGISTWGITQWDGLSFDSLGGGMLDVGGCFPVIDVIRYKGNIYTGGANFPGIVKWDGSSWQAVGGGIDGVVYSLEIINNELYVGGIFDSVGTIAVNGLAKWNDTIWSDVHALPNYTLSSQNWVFCMEVFQGELYIGGNFSGNGGYELVKWDGVSWQTVGGGFQGSFAQVTDMVIYNNELYVGGSFSKSAGNPGNAIAKWDGNQWYDVGGGMSNANISNLQFFNNELYAVGGFTMAGGVPAYGIAKWDGNEWCGLGNYPSAGIPTSIAIYNNELYLACDLTFNNDTVNYIVKWSGGSIPADTCGAIIGINEVHTNNHDVLIYPNPAQNELNVAFYLVNKGKVKIAVHNIVGQKIYEEEIKNGIGDYNKKINIENFAKGVYTVSIYFEEGNVVKKFIKQ